MRVLDAVRDLAARLAGIVAGNRRSDFTCGDCERWERCGLPPSDRCIVMAAQIARDGGRRDRRRMLVEW